jgi:mitochondrial fission protein ELM1
MLDVLVLLIDKPGHRHQAEGVARAVERADGARITRIEVAYRWWAFAALRARVAKRARANPRFWLRLLYGIDPARLPRADLVISSGRPAIVAGILLGRAFAAPFVYSGLAKDNGLGALIDLQLVPLEAYDTLPNTAVAPFPTLVDPAVFAPVRPLRQREDFSGARIGLLLGGDAHSHRFTSAEWRRIRDLVEATHAELGVTWRIFTSRRTGAVSDLFTALAGKPGIETVVDWRVGGATPPADLFAGDALVVTEDSASMMYEAVAARRPVIALRPARVKPSTMDEIVAQLAARGALAAMPIAGLDVGSFVDRLCGLAPIGGDDRDRIRAALDRLIGPVAAT